MKFKAVSLLMALSGATLAFSPIAVAEEYSFNATCNFLDPRGEDIGDPNCKVTKYYSGGRWTGAIMRWSDGVVTKINILTVYREPDDRLDSRYGKAKIDGEDATYETYADGAVIFTIPSNGKTFIFR